MRIGNLPGNKNPALIELGNTPTGQFRLATIKAERFGLALFSGEMMTTTQGEPRRPDSREQEGGLLEAVVCENVLSALGRPDASHRIQARRVGGDRYRVNVFVADSAATFRVAHSYFLEADGNGNILTSTPPILRVY